MAFLPVPPEVRKEVVTLNLESTLLAILDRYRVYLGRHTSKKVGRDYVISEALRLVFRKDKEFTAFLRTLDETIAQCPTGAASAAADLERPRGKRAQAKVEIPGLAAAQV